MSEVETGIVKAWKTGTPEKRASRKRGFFERASMVEAAIFSAVPILVDFCSTETWNYPGRESTLQNVHRQLKARDRILESYRRVKNSLKTLQDHYASSKDNHNIFSRYTAMKRMIKDVTVLETEWWTLLDVPKQELSENQTDYVGRVLVFLEQRLDQEIARPAPAKGISGLLGATTAQFTEKSKDVAILERLKGKSTDELRKESDKVQSEICKLVKKYSGLRGLVRQLKSSYSASKSYPIFPRYTMLKDVIKEILRDPAFSEVCHEIEIE